MALPFPNDPYLTGYYRPFGAEMDAADLVVEGAIPEELNGTFYRNGPDPAHPPHPDNKYHVFDGDGMIYAIRLADGRAAMRNRYVKTRKYELEKAAGRRLFGVFGNPRFNDPSVNMMDYNTANTHIWPHAGRLYALMEGCPPVALDPATLDTLGSEHFDGTVTGPFTAHPKTDPATGAMHAFGYSAKGPGSTAIRYNIVDAQGRGTHTAFLDQPYASMMHDFALTDRHVVFPCLPVVIDLMRAMQGKPLAAWESDRASHFGIMAKGGDGTGVRWVESDPLFAFHIANSFDDGEDLVIDVAGSRRAPLMPAADGTPADPAASRFTLKRWRIRGNAVHEEQIDGMDLQFPRIDDRWQGRRYRKAFVNGTPRPSPGRVDGFDTIATIDTESGHRDAFNAGDGAYTGEPVFVPRPGSSAEGDGWLLALRWDSLKNESALLILDAQHVSDGPVATIHMPARIPGGFHCSWMPA
ncbi:carotenoid oxygenase family protein [Sandaracinobacteroides saxicola]|uniref:Dioxygenase n=1 Tax=Sandaracinobacteroides saxicola TaxID=2759707 RepID=A0A7G5IL80_9SPHN|nr:carotenoid oxygenase family protein [Sandaracinobacteroides saxicola]QMW24122.1 carotenoid oxygenase family protein [Sandaracinobacteroides saxicola]